MAGQNPFTEEGRTRFRNFERRLGGYFLVSALLGMAAGVGCFRLWTRGNMTPLQKLYLGQYVLGSLKALASGRVASRYQLLTCRRVDPASGRKVMGGVTDAQVSPVRDPSGRPVRDENGFIFAWNPGERAPAGGVLAWRKLRVKDRRTVALFRAHHYGGAGLFDLLLPSLVIGSAVFAGATIGFAIWDRKPNRRYEQGRLLRGTRLVRPEKYRLKEGRPGLALPTLGMRDPGLLRKLWRGVLQKDEPVYWLQVPRDEETFHTTILGDTGMGKSQIILQFLRQIAHRAREGGGETCIAYDPKGEFLESHFDAARDDVVLNPLDACCPFWSPSSEIRLRTDYDLIAESFFPGAEGQPGTSSEFFVKASRQVFARLLEFDPDPSELVRWLTDAREIDERVAGTELAHLIDARAPQQRGGVLGSLAAAGKLLRLLPAREECGGEISLAAWAGERRGWIFITAQKEIREQARPLLAVFIDLLLKRSMSVDEGRGRGHPCWFVVDEADSLGRLPALYGALVEGRGYGLKLVIGTQNKSQFDEKYGQKATTMLSAAALKVMLRSNEPESARWVSELIGGAEWEKPRTGVTASVGDQGRDLINYMSQVETRPVVSREEVMGLPKLRGYWKYGDTVVPFRMKAAGWGKRAERFVPRAGMLIGPRRRNNVDSSEAEDGAVEAHANEAKEKEGAGAAETDKLEVTVAAGQAAERDGDGVQAVRHAAEGRLRNESGGEKSGGRGGNLKPKPQICGRWQTEIAGRRTKPRPRRRIRPTTLRTMASSGSEATVKISERPSGRCRGGGGHSRVRGGNREAL